jgi:hypothetical protein
MTGHAPWNSRSSSRAGSLHISPRLRRRAPASHRSGFSGEDGALWIIASLHGDSFPRRVEREPRCAIGIVDFDPEHGLVHHVGMRGRASIEPFDRNRAARLLRRYLGERLEAWDRRFQDTLEDPDNILIRFNPETIVARDQSYEVKR